MRLGYNSSGGGGGALNVTTISVKQEKLQLQILKTSFASLYGDAGQKRFHKLANALQLKPVVV